jgi:hypothetical protein
LTHKPISPILPLSKSKFLSLRRPGMSFEELKKYYLEVHAPLARKSFPEIKKKNRGQVSTFDNPD